MHLLEYFMEPIYISELSRNVSGPSHFLPSSAEFIVFFDKIAAWKTVLRWGQRPFCHLNVSSYFSSPYFNPLNIVLADFGRKSNLSWFPWKYDFRS